MLSWMISSSILILLMMALRAAVKERVAPRLRYALWLLVLVRLLLPVNLGSTDLSVLNAVERAETRVSAYTQTHAPVRPQTAPSGAGTGTAAAPAQTQQTPAAPQTSATVRDAGGSTQTAPALQAGPSGESRLDVADVLTVVWAAGAAVCAGFFLLVNIRFYVNLRRRRRAIGEYRGLPVYEAEGLASPCLAGFFRPAVYVTPELARYAVSRTHVLAHEYTHYRQRDYLWTVLRGVCLALHWYNPLVWWAAAASRRDCELSCDAGAVRLLGEEHRADYGRTLVAMVARAAAPGDLLCCATTMTGGRSAVKERVALLVKNPRTRAATLCAVAALALVITGCTFTGAAKASDDDLAALEAGFAAFEAAAKNRDTFDASLNLTGDWGADVVDSYQFVDREAVEDLTADMRRCVWTYQGREEELHVLDSWQGYSLILQSGGTGFTFCTDGPQTLVAYTAYEDGQPAVRLYRAQLPEDLREQYNSPYDLFYQIYLVTSPASGGTPVEEIAPEYVFTAVTGREEFPDETGRVRAYYDLAYPMVYLANAEDLPEETLLSAQALMRTFNGEMERRMEDSKAALEGYREDMAGDSGEPFYVTAASSTYVQGQIVSALMMVLTDSGGAHPNYGYDSGIFDLAEGRFTAAEDVSDDPDAFVEGAAEYLVAYADSFDASFREEAWEDWRDTVQNWPETGSACFLYDGLHVYFDPYTLGPYVLDGVELVASYDDIWDLLGPGGREKLGLAGPLAADGQTDESGQSAAPADTRADMAAAYTSVLELSFSGEQSEEYTYYDFNQTDPDEIAKNSFAIWDVDLDGQDELIINYNNTIMAGMNVIVYGYDTATGEVRQELQDFSAADFYDNGYVTVDASHNHGRNAMKGDWWPYSLYQYDGATDTYQREAIVDSWDKAWMDEYDGQTFPADMDKDGDGIVYYVEDGWEYENPMDGDAYRDWVNSWQAGAEKIEISWQSLTWDNIHALG